MLAQRKCQPARKSRKKKAKKNNVRMNNKLFIFKEQLDSEGNITG